MKKIDSLLGGSKQELEEARYFTLLADETKDIGKHEQLSIAFRYVYRSSQTK